jgi:hypothetical protein
MPDRNNLNEEGFVLAHGFRGFIGPMPFGRASGKWESVAEESCLHHSRQETEIKKGLETFKGTPSVTYFLHRDPPPKASTTSRNSVTNGDHAIETLHI